MADAHHPSLLAPQPLLLALHRLQLRVNVERRLAAQARRLVCMHQERARQRSGTVHHSSRGLSEVDCYKWSACHCNRRDRLLQLACMSQIQTEATVDSRRNSPDIKQNPERQSLIPEGRTQVDALRRQPRTRPQPHGIGARLEGCCCHGLLDKLVDVRLRALRCEHAGAGWQRVSITLGFVLQNGSY